MNLIPLEVIERECQSAIEKVEILADEKFSARERAIFALGYSKGLTDSYKFQAIAFNSLLREDGQ